MRVSCTHVCKEEYMFPPTPEVSLLPPRRGSAYRINLHISSLGHVPSQRLYRETPPFRIWRTQAGGMCFHPLYFCAWQSSLSNSKKGTVISEELTDSIDWFPYKTCPRDKQVSRMLLLPTWRLGLAGRGRPHAVCPVTGPNLLQKGSLLWLATSGWLH